MEYAPLPVPCLPPHLRYVACSRSRRLPQVRRAPSACVNGRGRAAHRRVRARLAARRLASTPLVTRRRHLAAGPGHCAGMRAARQKRAYVRSGGTRAGPASRCAEPVPRKEAMPAHAPWRRVTERHVEADLPGGGRRRGRTVEMLECGHMLAPVTRPPAPRRRCWRCLREESPRQKGA